MATISDSWGAVFEWIDNSGYVASGPCREVYLESESQNQDTWVTELQQPFLRRS
jgi:effector-binding domain-containing protein